MSTSVTPGVVHLKVVSTVDHAMFVDQGVTVPTRFPTRKRAMHWEDGTSDVFARRAEGFSTQGIHFIERGKQWVISNQSRYYDATIKRYLV